VKQQFIVTLSGFFSEYLMILERMQVALMMSLQPIQLMQW
jgi:hypothetical protein